MNKKTLLTFLIIAILGLLGISVVLISTHWGIGASPDSAVYIGAARNLLDGRGLTVPFGESINTPMTHHAPLYSVLLASVGAVGIDPMIVSRFLNAVLFGANISLVGFLVYYSIQSPLWVPVFGSIIMLTSNSMLAIHSMAWTEPIFIFFGLMGLFFLAMFLDRINRNYLLFASILLGLTLLTRYAGIAYIITGFLGILFLGRLNFRRRIARILVFFLISLLPMLVWMLWNTLIIGRGTNREIHFHPVGITQLWELLDTVSSWLLIPNSASVSMKFGVVAVVILAMLTAVYMLFFNRSVNEDPFVARYLRKPPNLILLLLIFILVYCAFLILSISFFDANTPVNIRIMSPVYVAATIIFLYFLARIWQLAENIHSIRVALFLSVSIFLVLSISKVAILVANSYENGIGLNSQMWNQSETLSEVNQYPIGTTIYSNMPHAIYFRTGKSAYGLPKKYDSVNQRVNPNYSSDLAMMKSRIEQEAGIIVYFTNFRWPTLPNEDELREKLSLKEVFQTNDAIIYSLDSGR